MKSINPNEPLLKLASRIKKLRLEKKLTQEDAYNDTGIHFGRIEQGKRDISFTTLKKICDYFNLSLEEFFSKGF
jgi:transcriptional regulator with XRE-family HTH domain